jgi:hypothetical protein
VEDAVVASSLPIVAAGVVHIPLPQAFLMLLPCPAPTASIPLLPQAPEVASGLTGESQAGVTTTVMRRMTNSSPMLPLLEVPIRKHLSFPEQRFN